ncbi:MAG: hypothetical protein ACOVRJ_16450 [Roseateles sp.]
MNKIIDQQSQRILLLLIVKREKNPAHAVPASYGIVHTQQQRRPCHDPAKRHQPHRPDRH